MRTTWQSNNKGGVVVRQLTFAVKQHHTWTVFRKEHLTNKMCPRWGIALPVWPVLLEPRSSPCKADGVAGSLKSPIVIEHRLRRMRASEKKKLIQTVDCFNFVDEKGILFFVPFHESVMSISRCNWFILMVYFQQKTRLVSRFSQENPTGSLSCTVLSTTL